MSFLFGRRAPASDDRIVAERLHDAIVAVVRRPVFYLRFAVPDTFEGRFDLLVLHVALALRRLRATGPVGESVAQQLVNTMFARFDVALRELGVSDIGVPKRMKRLAEAFNGRTASYYKALDGRDEQGLAEVIRRNLLGGASDGRDLARYALRVVDVLALCDLADPRSPFPDLPEPAEAI